MNTLIRTFFSDISRLRIGAFASGTSPYPFDESPQAFLEYAEAELIEGNPAKLGNALAHAERALAAQLDYFLYSYGLSEYAKANKWGNGKKIALLGDLGLIRENPAQGQRCAGNALEHRYQLPSYLTAVNAVDVVGIFVAATDMFLYPAREEVEFLPIDNSEGKTLLEEFRGNPDNGLFLSLDRATGAFAVNGNVLAVQLKDHVTVHASADDFFFLMSLLLNYHRLDLPKPHLFFNRLKYLKS